MTRLSARDADGLDAVSPRESGTVARETYRSISLYAPNRAPAAIDLSDNTNLWGVPPAALRAITDAASGTITRYPALYAADVKQAIADYVGLSPDMVVTGCGSDDVLDSAIRAFGEPGDVVAYPDPSFAMIPIFARMNGLVGAPIPLTAQNDADVEQYIQTNATVSYLCSPNNPTGASFSRDSIEQVASAVTGVVIIDEAYAEFAGWNCLDLLARFPRVVITRTLSKAFGLAGLRVGYALGEPALVAEIEKSRGPYKVNAIAQHAAVAALTADRTWVDGHIRDAIENRTRLRESLIAIGFKPLPSDSNFVLVPVNDAQNLDQQLRARGIAVRPFVALPNIGDALRISVGPWHLLEQCVAALQECAA
ncbi:MAG TPA: histidinol-phosphate transaminase [Gemmatimonadaceae bacterium]|nr:histidinol-phosphate transaminase [Gemmatimonadaceae bacterium]